ncbi:MAG: hypothetical protein HUJ29_13835 [Gammaproteobacteria bacterium]|nr:hypothetical protein [Gammaproteobacteria bacterium]
MRVFIFISLFFLVSAHAQASTEFMLEHELIGLEQGEGETRITYKLTLSNSSVHAYHSLGLMLEHVALSLSPELQRVSFNTLPAGANKHRFITLVSSSPLIDLQQPYLLLFHLEARDASGNAIAQLIRSRERVQ